MTLVKTSVLNGLAVLTRVFTALALNKLLAVIVGPSGYAVIGQFQSLVSMVMGVASGAVSTGVTKYTAEYQGEAERQLTVWQTATRLGLGGAALGGVLLVLLREPLAARLLGKPELSGVFLWLALSLLLMVGNSLMLAILNGRKEIRALVLCNIAGSLIGAGVSMVLVWHQGLYGALVALGLGQAASALLTAWIFRRICQLRWRAFIGGFDPAIARRLGAFALMTLVSALVVPLTQVFIRDWLGQHLGWHTAGLWQALWRISDLHLMLLTTTLSVYFLPRFAELAAGAELRREVARAYRFVVPLVVGLASSFYLLRDVVVPVMLTREFLPLTQALGWQLVGDVVKICSWIPAYTMISHARTGLYIVTELVFAGLLLVFSCLGGAWFGLPGTAAGYALTYLLYLLAMTFFFLRFTRPSESRGSVRAGATA